MNEPSKQEHRYMGLQPDGSATCICGKWKVEGATSGREAQRAYLRHLPGMTMTEEQPDGTTRTTRLTIA